MQTYVISYDDVEALNKKIDEIKDALNMEFDVSKYDLEEDSIYDVIDDCNTISLFQDPKFIIVKSAERIESISDKQLKELLMALNDLESNNILIFCLDLDNESKAKDKINKIKKYSLNIEIRLKNISLEDYTNNRMKNDGYIIDNDAINLLCSYSSSLLQLRSNIEILECFKMDNKKIDINDIELLIRKPLEDNVYNLVNAVLKNDKKLAYSIYKDLMITDISSTNLVALLLNKFQEIYNAYYLVKSKYSQQDIANLYNISPNRAYYVMNEARSANIYDIKKNIQDLNNLEYNIKSGKINQDLGFELFLLN